MNKQVFVFVEEDTVVSPGEFDQWCTFANNETEAKIQILIRYRLGEKKLKLIQTFEDRRKDSRRGEDRRS